MRRERLKRKNKNNKNNISNYILFLLCIALLIVFVGGTIRDKKIDTVSKEEYNNWLKSKEEAYSKEKFANVYEKIKGKEPIDMLVLGDSMAISEGVKNNSDKWALKLEKWIEDTYGCEVNLTNLSVENAKVSDGLNIFENNKNKNVDLVLLCYGEKDKGNEKFPFIYESLIRNIKEKIKNVEIVTVVEHGIKKENKEYDAVIDLSKHYNTLMANVREGFLKNELPYKKLQNNFALPNEDGDNIYFESIRDVLEKNIKSNKVINDDEVTELYKNTKNFMK